MYTFSNHREMSPASVCFIKKLALSAIFKPAKYSIETNEARNNRCQRLNAQQIDEMLPVLSQDTSAEPGNNFKTMQQ